MSADRSLPAAGQTSPLAVLIGHRYGEVKVRTLPYPPPPEVRLPRPCRHEFDAAFDPSLPLPEHRRFVLQRGLRSTEYRWWMVYNNGRSRTPRDGFVYLEKVR